MPDPAASLPRAHSAAALAATIGLGLASRAAPLPGPFAEHTGDALYTVAVCWALGLLRPRTPAVPLAVVAFGVSAAVEFSQRLDWPWLVALRGTTPGRLLLGQGFSWADLVAYAIGAALACCLGRLMRRPARS